MSATLIVKSATKGFRANLPTAVAELVNKVITDRLEKGLSTPLLMETADGHDTDLIEVHSADDYTMSFVEDGDPSLTTARLEMDAKEANHIISSMGYFRITT